MTPSCPTLLVHCSWMLLLLTVVDVINAYHDPDCEGQFAYLCNGGKRRTLDSSASAAADAADVAPRRRPILGRSDAADDDRQPHAGRNKPSTSGSTEDQADAELADWYARLLAKSRQQQTDDEQVVDDQSSSSSSSSSSSMSEDLRRPPSGEPRRSRVDDEEAAERQVRLRALARLMTAVDGELRQRVRTEDRKHVDADRGQQYSAADDGDGEEISTARKAMLSKWLSENGDVRR